MLGAVLVPEWKSNNNLLLLSLLLIGAALIHLASNTFNDYFDYRKGSDSKETKVTPFSGGSGLLVEELLTPGEVLTLSFTLLLFALLAGFGVIYMSPASPGLIIALGTSGVLLGYCYTASPFQLAYRGAGEIAVFIAFGPLPVIAAYCILGGNTSQIPLLASLPPGIMTAAILWINQFPDFETDRNAGKCNLLVGLGLSKGRYVYYSLILIAAFFIWAAVHSGGLPLGSLWALTFLAPALAASVILHNNYGNVEKLVPAMALTIIANTLMSLIMVVTVLI